MATTIALERKLSKITTNAAGEASEQSAAEVTQEAYNKCQRDLLAYNKRQRDSSEQSAASEAERR